VVARVHYELDTRHFTGKVLVSAEKMMRAPAPLILIDAKKRQGEIQLISAPQLEETWVAIWFSPV
jgi:hypothetical protein